MNLIETLEREAIDALTKDKPVPEFRPGDTLRVGVKVIEGERTRVQNFEGVCIARANKGVGSSFTVRKISFGEGVERVFPLYSPIIDHIEVVRPDDVQRYDLWAFDRQTGHWSMLVDSQKLGGGQALSEAEKMQRERKGTVSLKGIVTYDWSADGKSILVPLDGALYLAGVDRGV